VAGTNINNLSSFFSLDSADVPVENGQIMSLQRASRLQGTGTMLLALCEKETSYALLGEQELTQGNNTGLVSVSDNVIGTIKSLGYNFGLQEKGSVYNQKVLSGGGIISIRRLLNSRLTMDLNYLVIGSCALNI